MDQRIFAGITVAILILSSVLLYFNDEAESNEITIGTNGLVPVWERVNQPFNTTGSYSYTLEPGEYDICLLYTSPSPRDS